MGVAFFKTTTVGGGRSEKENIKWASVSLSPSSIDGKYVSDNAILRYWNLEKKKTFRGIPKQYRKC